MAKTLDNVEQKTLDSAFGYDYSDEDGFAALESVSKQHEKTIGDVDYSNRLHRAGSGVNETKMIPFVLHTDVFTATQTTVLLNMIRYCMEKSAEGRSGDNKEFTFTVHVQNRSNSDFILSIGDEPQGPIAYQNDVFIGH